MKHACNNCGAVHETEDLAPIKDLSLRLEPGDVVPTGECPDCGAMCHPVTDPILVHTVVFHDYDGCYAVVFSTPAAARSWVAGWFKVSIAQDLDLDSEAQAYLAGVLKALPDKPDEAELEQALSDYADWASPGGDWTRVEIITGPMDPEPS